MVKPSDAADLLRSHFADLTPDQFITNLRRWCPDVMSRTNLPRRAEGQETGSMSQLLLFPPSRGALPLKAYLACALTGLEAHERQLVYTLSDVVTNIAQSVGIEVYEPRKKTDPVHHREVPDTDVFRIDRDAVGSSDLLIHLCHFPSTGAGEELSIAHNAFVPILLIAHSETRISRMITGIPSFKVEINYTEPEEMREQLRDRLLEIRPILEERKLAFSQYDVNIVGDRVRMMREQLGLTREEIAQSTPNLREEYLRQLEESTDRLSNPSLLQLRELAAILKTTVADLVEPDINERVVAILQEWIEGRTAARFSGITVRDRNRIIRRLLYRLMDSLEAEEDRE